MAEARCRVLVLGGTGFFGATIARRLAADPHVELVLAGRRFEAVQAAALPLRARAVLLDIDAATFAQDLEEVVPDVVVHAAGPYVAGDYRVAEAAIAAGAHLVDLADSRRYVCDVVKLDEAARARGVAVIAGASSVPALSAAVVDAHAGAFARLDQVEMGIASSARMPGVGTVRSVLAYAGRPVVSWREGAPYEVRGWCGLRRRRFVHAPLVRWLCDCDVPDLEIFPKRYPSLRKVRFSAGTGLAPVQWALRGLAGLATMRVVREPANFAGLLHRAGRALERFGDGRSAMFVTMRGFDRRGDALVKNWEVHASHDRGPEIPTYGAVALVRKLARETLAARGAMPCVGLLTLDEYLAEADPRHVHATCD